jgi:flagellar hook-length control protein FliK
MLTGTVRQAIEEGMPHEKLHEIVSRPEIAVRQVVLITEPVKFLRQFMPEVVLPDHQQNAVSRESNERVSTTIVTPVKDDSDATRYNSDNRGSDRFSNNQRDDESLTEKRILRPDKLDVQRLVRDTGRTVQLFDKNADKASLSEYEMRSLDLLPKQNPLSQTVNQTTIDLKGDNQRAFVEPVRFTVHLPDPGLKITEISSFKVSLKPESLGNVKVHLIMVDNQLTARLSVESTAARQAVEANLPILKETLEQHGIRAENFSVNIAAGGNPNRQRNSRRDAPPVKQSTRKFSHDVDTPAPISIEAMRVASGGNLVGTLNLVA